MKPFELSKIAIAIVFATLASSAVARANTPFDGVRWANGSQSLRFDHGAIVTATETGGRVDNRGVENTLTVSGSTVTLARKHAVALSDENR